MGVPIQVAGRNGHQITVVRVGPVKGVWAVTYQDLRIGGKDGRWYVVTHTPSGVAATPLTARASEARRWRDALAERAPVWASEAKLGRQPTRAMRRELAPIVGAIVPIG